MDHWKVMGTILKHDSRVISHKITVLRTISDVVLAFLGLHTGKMYLVCFRGCRLTCYIVE
jgi:hypothetical protein